MSESDTPRNIWRKAVGGIARRAAEAGVTAGPVIAAGVLLALLAFWLFWIGDDWIGALCAFAFVVLNDVADELAASHSRQWERLRQGIDLIHPPFWWWAWAHGLAAYGRPLEPVYQAMLLVVIVIGYLAQRVIDALFVYYFKMHIEAWRPLDSRFHFFAAGPIPNLVILLIALLFGRPDVGLELVALWTILSVIFDTVRLAQAKALYWRGQPVVSWRA